MAGVPPYNNRVTGAWNEPKDAVDKEAFVHKAVASLMDEHAHLRGQRSTDDIASDDEDVPGNLGVTAKIGGNREVEEDGGNGNPLGARVNAGELGNLRELLEDGDASLDVRLIEDIVPRKGGVLARIAALPSSIVERSTGVFTGNGLALQLRRLALTKRQGRHCVILPARGGIVCDVRRATCNDANEASVLCSAADEVDNIFRSMLRAA